VDKKTAAEIQEIVKQRIGAGDFKVTVTPIPTRAGTLRSTATNRRRFIAAK
jgi:hypothetical protein